MMIHHQSHSSLLKRRRGVVLILVLGMLALLALIGVTFATFASQSKIGARNFAQTVNTPVSADLMDYALSQLINDTDNPLSAIRGHSLKRDMYGNDGATNGILTSTTNGPLLLTSSVTTPANSFVTNIPYFAGTSYVGWILKLAPTSYGFDVNGNPVVASNASPPPQFMPAPTMQSFVIIADAADTSNTFHQFQLSTPDSTTLTNDIVNNSGTSTLILPANVLNTNPFILDGRYRFAFNGPGITDAYGPFTDSSGTYTNLNPAQFANYRVNQGFLQSNLDISMVTTVAHGQPSSVGMDEDYDACDLENWFMAIQSADGNIVVPSFHRPGILSTNDWTSSAVQSMAKILRPRAVDHNVGSINSFGQSFPDPSSGTTFDVDNDADGKTDSVWLDLGYAPRRNAQGKLYKPLFAFMVIGLNGRIPLNTAGNLAARDPTNGSQNLAHTSHLGNSVSEIDPTYALQNAYFNSQLNNPVTSAIYGQADDSGRDVRATQLQNLLAGTRPIPPEVLSTNPILFDSTGSTVSGATFSGTAKFGDMNYAPIDGNLLTGVVSRYYMPNGVVDTSDIDTTGAAVTATDAATVNVARIANTPNPIAGRWGEAPSISGLNALPSLVAPYLTSSYNNPPRAGYSLGNRDVDDDNLNAFDPYGSGLITRQGEIGDSDLYDSSNSPLLPVERIRRFVTPADIDGSGRIRQWTTAGNPSGYGGDAFGRIAFLSYFRPAGLPGKIDPFTGLLSYNVAADAGTTAVNLTNNPLHGYDFFRFPALATATPNAQRLGGSPADVPLDPMTLMPTADAGKTIPTYDFDINSGLHTDGLNDADEMNLYATSRYDQPYGPSDLEWLYRSQDVDGSSLSSRLSQLAPISFTNTSDGQRRRRLFSTDSWELNRAAWANDNPQNNPSMVFGSNSRFNAMDNASFANLGNNTAWKLISSNPDPVGTAPYYPPPLAQAGKKINLNYPLPVSNDPYEPVRQKWIRETYITLKAILPPKAVDTAEELAQLSQYVVNIIDFRDPDATLTRFVNSDVTVVPATAGANPTLTLTTAANQPAIPYSPLLDSSKPYLIQFGMEYCPVAINEVLAYSYVRKSGGAPLPSSRFFVELVNTVTDSALSPAGGPSAYPFDLSGSNLFTPAVPPTTPWDNGCWDLVFTDDTPQYRPDPYQGQIPPTTGAGLYGLTPLSNVALKNATTPTLAPLTSTATTTYSSASSTTSTTANLPANYYYVIGSQPATTANSATDTSESPAPGIAATQPLNAPYDPVSTLAPPAGAGAVPAGVIPGAFGAVSTATSYPPKLPQPMSASSKYYWVCLRRPANPFAPVTANNPMVVVDSMRFPYTEAGGKGTTSGMVDTVTVGPNALYSSQRLQPYRGGHAVLSPSGILDWRYGYSEQIAAPTNATGNYVGTYGVSTSPMGTPITKPIYHTLTLPNDPTNYEEPWNYLMFNDRDFSSVAELLMVPGCPPGLFTKQFIELPFNKTNQPTFTAVSATTGAPKSFTTRPTFAEGTASLPFGAPFYPSVTQTSPQSFPYLVDKFFYSAQNLLPSPPIVATNNVDDPTGAGWFRMFEFFEVPSQSMGAYGPVAQGANFDWLRQDVKPGLINLNLIIDEEVFLSVFGRQNATNYAQTLLNFTGTLSLPSIVTSINPTTNLPNTTPITSTGYIDTANGSNYHLKPAFVQFLNVRHGGSGYLFGFGSGVVGTNTAVERPFRSLSYPDINQTIMRPASLPPSASSTPAWTDTDASTAGAQLPATQPATAGGPYFVYDPGLKNPYLYPGYVSANFPAAMVNPPAIPARRLFQAPDSDPLSNATLTQVDAASGYLLNQPTTNGGVDANPPNYPPVLVSGAPVIGTSTAVLPNEFLGTKTSGTGPTTAYDRSQHPYFRTEMLQKVMNLTTVRTHQYAVWITVGFFEVTRAGNPDLVDSAPALAYDQLGREIGLNGKIVRYRGFYVVDRTKATGFNPANPGDYHNCVVYGHVIQ